MTIQVLQEQGQSHSQTARLLKVTEGTVRYHLRRAQGGAVDGRHKLCLIQKLQLEAVVSAWWEAHSSSRAEYRPPSIGSLWDYLREDYGYTGSYKSVYFYVRRKFPRPKLRPFRRVETPPGVQGQSDWGEFRVDIGRPEGASELSAFVMALSHSRKVVVVWSSRKDELAWQTCHTEAFKRLGGVPAVNRIDNVKTGVQSGAGAFGEINAHYRRYAQTMGFHVDACEPHAPEQKGKVERQIGVLRHLDITDRCFESLAHLQEWTDLKLAALSTRRICPATGKSVAESWTIEKAHLRPLPDLLPEPFDLVKTCAVHKDCTVRFEGRTYVVPFRFALQTVEVRGCAEHVRILDPHSGEVVASYPRHTQARIQIDPACFEGPATAEVERPKPLGRMAQRIQELAQQPVAQRPVDWYAALAEVAR